MNFFPTGTVYGTLLNFRGELEALGDQVNRPPYKAAPKAPVLYVKPANTWSAHEEEIPVPPRVSEVGAPATGGSKLSAVPSTTPTMR